MIVMVSEPLLEEPLSGMLYCISPHLVSECHFKVKS